MKRKFAYLILVLALLAPSLAAVQPALATSAPEVVAAQQLEAAASEAVSNEVPCNARRGYYYNTLEVQVFNTLALPWAYGQGTVLWSVLKMTNGEFHGIVRRWQWWDAITAAPTLYRVDVNKSLTCKAWLATVIKR